MTESNKANKKIHFIFAALFLAILSLCLVLTFFNGQREAGNRAVIYLDGKEYLTFRLFEDQIINVEGLCTVVCENGRVHIENSTCPDKLCEKQGELKHLPLTCLPNRITVKLIQKGEPSVDAIAG